MIDPAYGAGMMTGPQIQSDPAPRKVLRMVANERMGGSVPAWVDASSVREEIQENLRTASLGPSDSQTSALGLNKTANITPASSEEPFGFADLLDMINPLQHIPVVGHLYRSITGDTIRPASSIIGGTLFAGPLGAASGLANAIVREETGKDITGNVINFAMNGERPQYKSEKAAETYSYSTQTALADLPGALLAFTDLSHPEITIEKIDDEKIHLTEKY
jgi:hypothetical protein